MIIWHTKINRYDYNAWDAFVVIAPDEASARALVYNEVGNEWGSDQVDEFTKAVFVKIGLTFTEDPTTRVVCASFNAG